MTFFFAHFFDLRTDLLLIADIPPLIAERLRAYSGAPPAPTSQNVLGPHPDQPKHAAFASRPTKTCCLRIQTSPNMLPSHPDQPMVVNGYHVTLLTRVEIQDLRRLTVDC